MASGEWRVANGREEALRGTGVEDHERALAAQAPWQMGKRYQLAALTGDGGVAVPLK